MHGKNRVGHGILGWRIFISSNEMVMGFNEIRLALAKYTELSSTHAAVNVLLTTYQKEKIDLWQSFIHFTGRLRKLDLKNAI